MICRPAIPRRKWRHGGSLKAKEVGNRGPFVCADGILIELGEGVRERDRVVSALSLSLLVQETAGPAPTPIASAP